MGIAAKLPCTLVREGTLSVAPLAPYGHSARAWAPSWLLGLESTQMLVMGGGGHRAEPVHRAAAGAAGSPCPPGADS